MASERRYRCQSRIEVHREHPLGLESRLDAFQPVEAPERETGSGQENERDRELRDDESGANTESLRRGTPACGEDRRERSRAEPRRDREAESERERAGIQAAREIPRCEPLGESHQDAGDGPCEDDAQKSAAEAQQERLGEERPHESDAAGADGGPKRELAAPAGELGEVEVGDVRAGDEENESRGREEQEERRTGPPGKRLGEGHGRDLLRLDIAIGLGPLDPEPRGDGGDLVGSGLDARSGSEARECSHHSRGEARRHRRRRAKGTGGDRHEHVVGLWESGKRREDSHDAVRPIVHLENPPDHRRVAAVPALPVLVAQDQYRLGSDRVLSRKERPAQNRPHLQHVEEAGGDDSGVDSLRDAVPQEGEGHRVVLDHGLESSARRSIEIELRNGERQWGKRGKVTSGRRGPPIDQNHTGRVGVGKRLEEHVLHDAEDRGVHAHAEGEGRDHDEGETRRAPQNADRGASVLGE